MCGIYGYIGKKHAYNEVLNGLFLLQYRGYDSCGIAYYKDNRFIVNKAIGTLDNLEDIDFIPNMAFGHTRWATNGEVNLVNTHPHVSFDNQFTIVHNGIITNADELKLELKNKGIPFLSDTDTEVICNILSNLEGEVEQRILKLYDILKGSFSLIIGCQNGDMYLLKRFSPLHLVISDSNIFISSDVDSMQDGQLYSLQDGDAIKISNNTIINLKNQELSFTTFNNDIEINNLGKYNHFMIKEIYEIPRSIKDTYNYLKYQNFLPIFDRINHITFIGCGTAYHSCLIGQNLLERLNKYNLETCLASNYDIKDKIKKQHLHIIVSQSGETADCIRVANDIKTHGGKILVITNQENSTLSKLSDYQLFTKANKELAVASTKTYCCQVFAFSYILNKLKDKNFQMNIDEFTNDLNTYLKSIDIKEISSQLKSLDKLLLIGRDIDYLILLEASLKIREIDYMFTLPMYSGELKHGTLSLVNEECVSIVLNSSLDDDRFKTVINEISSRKGKIIDMSRFIKNLKIPKEYLAIYSIIPFQLLSYYLAIEKGINPDMPRNLAKSVTVE